MPETSTPSTHTATKARYLAYQDRARALAQSINRVMDQPLVEVSAQPTVWEVEEGAFVEAVIWVAKEREG